MEKAILLIILFFLFPVYPNIVFAEDKNSEIEIVLRQGYFSDVNICCIFSGWYNYSQMELQLEC